jgi:hypothetical protein
MTPEKSGAALCAPHVCRRSNRLHVAGLHRRLSTISFITDVLTLRLS